MVTFLNTPQHLSIYDGVDIENVTHTESEMTATLKSSSSLPHAGASLNAETLCNGLSNIVQQNL